MVANLVRFADLLDLWSSRTNLISCSSARELVDRHFLDSLAIAPLLPDTGSIVDLGTGAGFPGIPLATIRPQQRFVLVESRRRRVSFLREAKRTLDLMNLEILEQRAEVPGTARENGAAAVISRAVWSDHSFLEIAGRWLDPSGRIFWMRSVPLPDRPSTGGFARERTVRYRIGSERLRVVDILRLEIEAPS
jgi:16S rRNA (guanine527-N7)-methyltransferase